MEKVYYWSDIAKLTHATQVEEFGFCTCEEQEYFPYDDCPKTDDELYIEKHIREEHDYSYATDERPYDLCLYCDCRRMVNEDAWQIGN